PGHSAPPRPILSAAVRPAWVRGAAIVAEGYGRSMDDSFRAAVRALLVPAGELALSYFGRVDRESKPDGTPVTEADRMVEEALVGAIERQFPGESVFSEEGHIVTGRAGAPSWYVDPIDGTGAFLSQLSYWGPTVCRVVDGRLQSGGLYVPRLGEFWYGEDGGGAWRDDRRLAPVEPTELRGDDVLFVPSRFHRRQPAPWPGKIRALGSSACHLAHVAAGGGMATIIPKWSLWDVGCGTVLIREVGRVIWGPSGVPLEPERDGPDRPFLAGAPVALRQLTDDRWPGWGR
ncbi:MAG: inositol monophosphatase, partial [Myxococcota bacterium]